jgi:hypothetical protein
MDRIQRSQVQNDKPLIWIPRGLGYIDGLRFERRKMYGLGKYNFDPRMTFWSQQFGAFFQNPNIKGQNDRLRASTILNVFELSAR